ncbi:hypothetical protein [Phaeodactylibacter luteus]|uniref:Uncharacterized protein n=1 Tax=Phaeodactylibacter luteus TaxID=1564516 RepID=A0A5C6RH85_9BACT|nr:hypothetical protein [Phaeodactylibacter luteus]TXB61497.1 hypothetical protein FRY97_18755 [Phaeodactylibacter luteus]
MNQTLRCPKCEQGIAPADINIHLLIAKCQACGNVFNFEQQYSAPGTALQQIPKERAEISMPPGIEGYQLMNELNLRLTWRNRIHGFLAFFTVAWNLFLIPFILMIMASGDLEMLLFLSLHLLVGGSLIYWHIACLLNKTTLQITPQYILIEHGPIPVPFMRTQQISATAIRQLYVEEYVAGHTNGNPFYRFALKIRLASGQREQLLKNLRNADEGLYVEQQIERFLKIEDMAERGEIA